MLPDHGGGAEWVQGESEHTVGHAAQQSVVSDGGASMPFPSHAFDAHTFVRNEWAAPFSRILSAEHDGKGNEHSLEWNYLSWQDRSAMSAANSLEERLPTLHARLMSRRQMDAYTFISARSNAVQPSQCLRSGHICHVGQVTEPCVSQNMSTNDSQNTRPGGFSAVAGHAAEGAAHGSTPLVSHIVAGQPQMTAPVAPTYAKSSSGGVSSAAAAPRCHNSSFSSHTLGSGGSVQEMSAALAAERRRVIELEEECKTKDIQMRELLSACASESRRDEDGSHYTKASHNTTSSASPDTACSLQPQPPRLCDAHTSLSAVSALADKYNTRGETEVAEKASMISTVVTPARVEESAVWRGLLDEVGSFLDLMQTMDHGAAAPEFDDILQAWQACKMSLVKREADAHGHSSKANGRDELGGSDVWTQLCRALQLEHRCVSAACARWRREREVQARAMQQAQDTLEDERRAVAVRMAEMTAEHEAEVQQLGERIAQLERSIAGGEHDVRAGQASRAVTAVARCDVTTTIAEPYRRSDPDAASEPRCAVCDSVTRHAVTRAVQTDLSQDFIMAALQAVRERATRTARRERESELLVLALREIERLQLRLTESELHAAWLEEQRARFLGPVDVPLSYCEGVAQCLAGVSEVPQLCRSSGKYQSSE